MRRDKIQHHTVHPVQQETVTDNTTTVNHTVNPVETAPQKTVHHTTQAKPSTNQMALVGIVIAAGVALVATMSGYMKTLWQKFTSLFPKSGAAEKDLFQVQAATTAENINQERRPSHEEILTSPEAQAQHLEEFAAELDSPPPTP